MKAQAGFNLVEIFAVLVVLLLLGAMAVPRFGNDDTETLEAAKADARNAVKTAHALYIAKNKALPDVAALASLVSGESTASGSNDGIKISVNGNLYLVPTYTDTDCSSPTGDVKHTVRCIGKITP